MNLMTRLSLSATLLLAIALPCRRAIALENGGSAASAPSGPAPVAEAVPNEPADVRRDSAPTENEQTASRRTDHFRVGVLGSVGFPRPLALEGLVKIERLVGVGLEYSLLPKLSISGVNTHFWALAADARIFPFRNAFFVGLRAGRQHLGGEATATVAGYGSLSEAVSVDTTFVNPRVGFLWTWDPGVTLGVNIGVQIPVSSSSTSSLPAGVAVSSNVSRVTNSLGKYALPTVDLLQIGVLL